MPVEMNRVLPQEGIGPRRIFCYINYSLLRATERYNSYTAYAEGCGANAFFKDWSHEKFYAFSPFAALPKILTKNRKWDNYVF